MAGSWYSFIGRAGICLVIFCNWIFFVPVNGSCVLHPPPCLDLQQCGSPSIVLLRGQFPFSFLVRTASGEAGATCASGSPPSGAGTVQPSGGRGGRCGPPNAIAQRLVGPLSNVPSLPAPLHCAGRAPQWGRTPGPLPRLPVQTTPSPAAFF